MSSKTKADIQKSSHISARERRFTGSTYILTGPLTYSAATSFPSAARCYQSAFLVGEETGQPLVSNGDQKFICLATIMMKSMECFLIIP